MRAQVPTVRLTALGMIVVGLMPWPPVRAETPGPPVDLSRVIVTATRSETTVLDVPSSATTLDESDLRLRRQARTLPEALREQPGIMVQKTAHGQGSPFLRGFTGFQTLLLIDGIRLNNSTFRDGPNQYWNTVDPLALERLEIVKGPASVLYGSDAVGGTVNAVSRSAASLQQGTHVRTYYRYSDAENANVGRAELYYRTDGLSGAAGVSVKDFGDLEGGEQLGIQPHTAYSEFDADFQLEYEASLGERWVIAYQQVSQDDAWRTHRTIHAKSWEGTSVGDEQRRSLDQKRKLAYLQYHRQRKTGPFDEVHASFSYHVQEETQLRIRGDDRSDEQGTDVGTSGLWLQLSRLATGGRWDYGLEYYHDEVDSFRRDFAADGSPAGERIQGPVADDARYELLGAYVQRTLARSPLEWTFGARYNYAAAAADKVEDPVSGQVFSLADHWDSLVASARVSYTPSAGAGWRLFSSLAQGFRAPNLSDLTRLDTARSNEIETPVAQLEPERFLAFEIGYKAAFERGSIQFSGYYTDVRDLIVRTPTGRMIDGDSEVTKRNSGGGHVTGFEAEWAYRLGGPYSIFGSLTWTDGEVDTFPTSAPMAVTEPIDRLMPFTWHGGLRWAPHGKPHWIEAVVVHADEQDELSTRDRSDTQRIPPGGTPAYTVLHLRSGFDLGERLELAAAIENLTNEDYRVHGSGLNEPGRNLTLTVSWRSH